jgi:hypothetical protein
MTRLRLFALCSLVAIIGGCAVRMNTTPPEAQDYGPPVAHASIITLSPAEELELYGPETPPAEQGEGGPDSVVLEPWLVPPDECLAVRSLLARHDLIGPTADRLVWLAREESDCGATKVNDASGDYGIWQVNWSTWGAALCRNADTCTTPYELTHDDDLQAEVVAVLLSWEGWSAWCWSTPDHHARGIGYACPWEIGDDQG